MQRTEKVSIRMTLKEKNELQAQADKREINLSELIRKLLFNKNKGDK